MRRIDWLLSKLGLMRISQQPVESLTIVEREDGSGDYLMLTFTDGQYFSGYLMRESA